MKLVLVRAVDSSRILLVSSPIAPKPVTGSVTSSNSISLHFSCPFSSFPSLSVSIRLPLSSSTNTVDIYKEATEGFA